jgi:hypothetical protein
MDPEKESLHICSKIAIKWIKISINVEEMTIDRAIDR